MMLQLSSLLFGHAAFTALCLAMDGHHREAFGAAPRAGRARLLRRAGWLLLLFSFLLALALGAQGVVAWIVTLTPSAVVIALLLAYLPRRVAMLGWLGLAGAWLALAGAAMR